MRHQREICQIASLQLFSILKSICPSSYKMFYAELPPLIMSLHATNETEECLRDFHDAFDAVEQNAPIVHCKQNQMLHSDLGTHLKVSGHNVIRP